MAKNKKNTGQSTSPTVTQDNTLVEACYSMTLNEKRLLALGMSKVDSNSIDDLNKPLGFTITSEDWIQAFGDSENPYLMLRRAAKSLLGRTVLLHPKTGVEKEINWFEYVEYVSEKAHVELVFTRSIQLRLQGLLAEFTRYELADIKSMRSSHAIRLYELLMQFKSTMHRTISVEDFRIAMDCVDKYESMRELNRRVVNPSIKEINEKTKYTVSMKPKKRGVKIVSFTFVFNDDGVELEDSKYLDAHLQQELDYTK